MELLLEEIDSPVGKVLLVSDGDAVRALDYAGYESRMDKLLTAHWGRHSLKAPPRPTDFRRRVEAYFAGDFDAILAIPVNCGGTAFQQQVWAALRTIPAGETRTYTGIAQQISRPNAVRAVGAANALNPVAIIQPCHRVIGMDSKLTGYAGGINRKQWLLRHEHAAEITVQTA